MISRTIPFILAVALLVVAQLAVFIAKRRAKPFFAADQSPPTMRVARLLLASALTLFAELAFIRWISVEVRVFAYFKNLALLLCFLGFGFGCALAARKSRWLPAVQAFLGLLLIVRIPWQKAALPEGLSQNLGGAKDIGIWSTPAAADWTSFFAAVAMAGCLFVLLVSIFVPLGQTVSRQMDRAASALSAYSWNLIGSVIGVVAFFLMSWSMLPPSIWMALVLLGFAFLQENRRDVAFVVVLVVPLILILHDPVQHDKEILWTPYQEIEYTRQYTLAGDPWGGTIRVNHTFYQSIANLSPVFAARHPTVQSEGEDNPYNVPFRFAVHSPVVLIVGSGTGNDVAAALRHGSRSVDAVEIDPAILDLGRREHPEHPYDSPHVAIHLEDARSFLKRTEEQYDLILFGLLDSHAQFSDYSNMRIDNFVYTEEAFREAAQHLTPSGIIFVKFNVERPWLQSRFAEMLGQVFGHRPVVFRADSDYTTGGTCFAISRSSYVDHVLISDPVLGSFVRTHAVVPNGYQVPNTTDDWPYLYQRDRSIPSTYYSVSFLVILISIVGYARLERANRGSKHCFLFFFSMGAGFLLLETQIVSRLALFFGTVWQVNGIVISALLAALLLANAIVERTKSLQENWIWIGLLASLAAVYWFPFDHIDASPRVVGTIAIGLFSIPVLFAGVLFSCEFRKVLSPSSALNANVLGAVAGGLLENLSLVYGLRALLLVAIVLYGVAGLGLRLIRTEGKLGAHWRRGATG